MLIKTISVAVATLTIISNGNTAQPAGMAVIISDASAWPRRLGLSIFTM